MAICKHCGQEMPENLGSRIIDRREMMAITQSELAKMIDISQANMSRIEKSNRSPTIAQLMKIASKLDVTPDDLLIGEK